MVDKYVSLMITQFKNLAEYRLNLLVKTFRAFVMTAALAALWYVLFDIAQAPIAGFTFSSFVMYLLVIRFIATFSPGSGAVRTIYEEIRSGDLAMRLIRPVNYIKWITARSIVIPLVSGIGGLVIVTIGALFLNIQTPSGIMLVLFAFSVAGTILLQYAISVSTGMAGFWIYEIWPVDRAIQMLRQVLSGELIPLTLFSPFIQSILVLLPFASLAFIPGGIYIGLFDTTTAMYYVLIQYVWALLIWLLAIFLYKKGLQHFEAQGG